MTTEDAESNVTVVLQESESRFAILVGEEMAGLAEFRAAPGMRAFTHTEVSEAHQGQGLAKRLVSAALNETRKEGLSVLPYCPMVRALIAKNSEYLDLVPEARRAEFGL
ncbi:GNAT family N-acetyltransferase [Nesterenkonia flava]|uniref:GNAT family N-acetyltransferase n=1 Tax=Nesterenkonia flava TaxID=469799 RepID=A0ABU1FWW9_9MICC|nr:GNAT family N-acetyltransferase [Nesterenkonia flava]MDR5712646.1 GNAT family N-acetyltransferase [Nesterenkonia flava]